ncbi:MAG TPA: LysR substrate-binding domain-containing protein [Burkholderiales bacterium]|nr:LysR substrate-binding domain-containing protein [Burkholderiales bacterium]
MELRQLRYFVRIVDLGSLSKAAADLYVAQPALSRTLGALEAELETPLLVRSVRGVTPTEAGKALYRQAQGMLRQASSIADEVRSAGAAPQGAVSVGIPFSASNILAPALLAAVRDKLPKVKLAITEAVSGALEAQLAAGRLDLSVLYERERRTPRVEEHALLVEELYLVSAGRAGRAEVTLAEAVRRPFILPGPANSTRQILDKAMRKSGGRLEVIAEVDSPSTMKAMVAAGLGATVLSRSALHPEGARPALAIQRIVRPTLSRALNLCTSRDGTATRASECVREILEETALGLVRRGVWKGATAAR